MQVHNPLKERYVKDKPAWGRLANVLFAISPRLDTLWSSKSGETVPIPFDHCVAKSPAASWER
jgi:hypothetical protein